MFIGHHALGFAAKRAAPRTSLGWLIAAPIFLDLVWPIFLLLGWEEVRVDPGNTAFTPLDFVSYPWSHSLAMATLWGILAGLLVTRITRDRRGGIVVGLLVVSHWFLDWATHRPDMPLYPGGPRLGLGLWNSVPGTLVVEALLFAAGLGLYLGATRPRDRVGTWSLVAYVVALLVTYVGAFAGPPPPDARALAWTSLGLWLVPLWPRWFDRHRKEVDHGVA